MMNNIKEIFNLNCGKNIVKIKIECSNKNGCKNIFKCNNEYFNDKIERLYTHKCKNCDSIMCGLCIGENCTKCMNCAKTSGHRYYEESKEEFIEKMLKKLGKTKIVCRYCGDIYYRRSPNITITMHIMGSYRYETATCEDCKYF